MKKNKIEIDKVLSSEWCRCKDTAKFAFKNYETFEGLNSFFQTNLEKIKNNKLLNYWIILKTGMRVEI